MKRIKWIERTNETLLDLVFGCLIWGILVEVIGLFIVKDRLSYTIGVALGTAVAVWMSMSIARTLERGLQMNRGRSQRFMTARSLLRWLVMLAVVWAGLRFDAISFPGVLLGIIGLKLAALLHTYTNVYVTRRLKRKGEDGE